MAFSPSPTSLGARDACPRIASASMRLRLTVSGVSPAAGLKAKDSSPTAMINGLRPDVPGSSC